MWFNKEQEVAYNQFKEEQEKLLWFGTRLTKQQKLARSLKRDSKGRFVSRYVEAWLTFNQGINIANPTMMTIIFKQE